GIRDFHVTGVQTCALPIFAALKQSPCGLIGTCNHHLDDVGAALVKRLDKRIGATIKKRSELVAARSEDFVEVLRTLLERLGDARSEEHRVGKGCGWVGTA